MRSPLWVGSRFDDRTTSQVSTRCHGQSGREDVQRCIYVGVSLVSATHADESFLCLPRLLSDSPAGWATLTCIGRRNLNETPTASIELVRELPQQLTPALRKNHSVQASLGSHVHARPLRRPSRRAREPADVQLLDRDYAVVLGEVGGELVMEVQAEPRFPRAKTGDLIKGPLVATASAAITGRPLAAQGFLTTGFPGKSPQSLDLTGRQRGAVVKLTSRCSHSRPHAKIKPHTRRTSLGGRRASDWTAEGNVPSEWISSDCQVADRSCGSTRPSEPNPPEFWDTDFTPSARKAAHLDFAVGRPRLDSKSITPPFATALGICRNASEEPRIGSVEIAQGLLQDVGMRLAQPLERLFRLREFSSSLIGVAQTGPPEVPSISTLLQTGVVNRPSTSRPARQRLGLTRGWIQPISVVHEFHRSHTAHHLGRNRHWNVSNCRRIARFFDHGPFDVGRNR
jgi:hypothetical protein